MSDQQAARRSELAAFLRTRRARLRPADVGLVTGNASGRRRTPGLRREEVAELSGVGLTWYSWLEQGRNITATSQVIDALARALLLDPDQHRHLRRLAGLALPDPPEDAGRCARAQRLVDLAAPSLAALYDRYFYYLAWNLPYARVRTDPATLPTDRRNLLWMMFTDLGNRAMMTRWEAAARAVLSQFRAAIADRPADPRATELITALTAASPQFRAWWAEYPVRRFRPATITLDHPAAGRLDLELFQLAPTDLPGCTLVLQAPATQTTATRIAHLISLPPPPTST
ncbi:helix-turn-helix transcriptional regulator [Actinomadura gamaensis]|uniref:Helix-turn-helix transcriptional regulator n=1 Tax=Actinomadura gamaensis TaxID=1763541 RepID=A0ABV9TVZ5_9ACTN